MNFSSFLRVIELPIYRCLTGVFANARAVNGTPVSCRHSPTLAVQQVQARKLLTRPGIGASRRLGIASGTVSAANLAAAGSSAGSGAAGHAAGCPVAPGLPDCRAQGWAAVLGKEV